MRNILIPTDFSINAGFAVEYGAEIAKKMGASITLMHSFHVPIFADQVYLEETTIDDWEKDCNLKLHEIAGTLSKDYGITVHTRVKIGFAVEEILRADEKYDLVVMGSKGESELGDAIFGNVTQDVIQQSRIPVLIIPPHIAYSPAQKIVLACNNAQLITPAVEKTIKDFVATYKSKLYFLNVVSEFDGPVSAAYTETNKIKRHFEDMDTSINVLSENKVIKGINDFTANIKADLVIMIPEKHNILERLFTEIHTRHMAKIATRPLLIVPSE